MIIIRLIEKIIDLIVRKSIQKSYNSKIINLYKSGYSESFSGLQFEEYCVSRLLVNGWNAKVTKKTGDHGVDIIAYLNGKSIGIQCKKYSAPVGNKAIQEVITGCKYYNIKIPIVVTNSTFTKQAILEGKKLHVFLVHISDFESLICRN